MSRKEYEKAYWARNRDKRLAIQRRYRQRHKEELAEKLRAWRRANPEKYAQQHERSYVSPARSRWLAANAERHREWRNERHARLYTESPTYRLSHVVRGRLRSAIGRLKRGAGTSSLLGCSWAELESHLERQFKPGMTWGNQGRHGWHVDHIIPLMAFDLSDANQVARACHYTNLQPLWADENIRKGHRERRMYGV